MDLIISTLSLFGVKLSITASIVIKSLVNENCNAPEVFKLYSMSLISSNTECAKSLRTY